MASRCPCTGAAENVRDWLHVGDHCRAIDAVLARGRPVETYNVGGGNEHRNIDIVHALSVILERRFAAHATLAARFAQCPAASGQPVSSLIRFVTDRPGHDWRYAIRLQQDRRPAGLRPGPRVCRRTREYGELVPAERAMVARRVEWRLSQAPVNSRPKSSV